MPNNYDQVIDRICYISQVTIPTVYQEGLNNMQVQNIIVNKVNQIIDKLNQNSQWVNQLLTEGVDTEVVEQMKTWLDDGTLANLINNKLLGDWITEFQNQQDNYEADMTQKYNVMKSQLDNFTTSETPDANNELIDIRVGWDGTTYPSAGDAVREQVENTLYSMKNVTSTSILDDFNNAKFNKIYMISTTGVLNHPYNNKPGILVTYSAQNSVSYCEQVFYTLDGGDQKVFTRYANNKVWSEWKNIVTSDYLNDYINNNNIINSLKIYLYNVTSTSILDDFNNAKTNTVYMISTTGILNHPCPDVPGVIITLSQYIKSYDPPNYGIQLYYTIGNGYPKGFFRYVFNGNWSDWNQIKTHSEVENELNNLSLSLFETIGIVGDSYASGTIYKDNSSYVIDYNKSWPQILARDSGVTFTNFSAGGLTTRTWLTDSKGLQLVQSESAKELYGLFLGINDYYHLGESYLGSIADITSYESYTEYPDTFYGNYGKIIEQIAIKAPDAFMIMSTVANTSELPMKFNAAIEEIAEHYGIPVIKQYEDSYFTSSFYLTQMIGGHPIAINYAGMANAIKRMLEECIKNNTEYFKMAFS